MDTINKPADRVAYVTPAPPPYTEPRRNARGLVKVSSKVTNYPPALRARRIFDMYVQVWPMIANTKRLQRLRFRQEADRLAHPRGNLGSAELDVTTVVPEPETKDVAAQ